jgi:bifunctional non-homologous end joining protein LigD
MLAVAGEAFDSDEYAFEVKWDGTRALAFVDAPGRYRLLNRRQIDITSRYPELSVIAELEPGTVLDGEIVVLTGGKPDFNALQSREHARNSMHIRFMASRTPATYIAFDQLFQRFRPVMEEPYWRRHELVKRTLNGASERLLPSEEFVGTGVAFFEAACEQGLEGIVAKRLSSSYAPGRRNGAWIKIKQQHVMLCAIIGFVPEGTEDFGSLLLAAEREGVAIYVGRVGSGLSDAERSRILAMLRPQVRSGPVIPCKTKAVWVEPAVYCRVRYMEQTRSGQLRAPVFVEVCRGD